MQPITEITIPTPCHEEWNQMLPHAAGRFCGSCKKGVVDFTAMTNQQIIDYLASATAVCGRLSTQQFASINRQLHFENVAPVTFWKKAMLVFSLLASTQLVKAQNKVTKPEVEHFVDSEVIIGKMAAPAKPLKTQTLTGVVVDGHGQPLLQVQVSAGNQRVFTDSRGIFTIKVPSNTKVISVSSVGWDTQTLMVRNKQGKYKIVMKEQAMILGGLGAIKRPKASAEKYLDYIIKPIKFLFG